MKHKFLAIILPAMILTPLLWLMAGCFYVPWFEHKTDSGPNIRAMIRSASSDREIRPSNINRSRVIKLLGEPRFESLDGSAIGYLTHTGTGYWVMPLCFQIDVSDKKCYAVRIVFDDADKLVRVDWVDVPQSYEPPGDLFALSDLEALAKLNKQGGPELMLPREAKYLRRYPATTEP